MITEITEDQPDNTQTEQSLDAAEGTSIAPAVKKINLRHLFGKRKAKAAIPIPPNTVSQTVVGPLPIFR